MFSLKTIKFELKVVKFVKKRLKTRYSICTVCRRVEIYGKKPNLKHAQTQGHYLIISQNLYKENRKALLSLG